MAEGDHDVHLVVPHLARVLPGHHGPELQHVDDELETVAEDEHADYDQQDRADHDLSLLTFRQRVQSFVPSSEMINFVSTMAWTKGFRFFINFFIVYGYFCILRRLFTKIRSKS